MGAWGLHRDGVAVRRWVGGAPAAELRVLYPGGASREVAVVRRSRTAAVAGSGHPNLVFRAAVSLFSGFSLVNTKQYAHSKCSEPWHVPDSGVKQVLTFRVSRPAIKWLRALPVPRVLTATSQFLDGGAAQTRPGLRSKPAVARDMAISDIRPPDQASPSFWIPAWKRPPQRPHQ